jgi:hypothetical protein
MKKECYGKIFPDLLRLQANKPEQGKAFTAFIESFGMGIHDRKISVKMSDFETCTTCPDYKTCYDLSLGKLMLQQGLSRFC